eukprot:359602-Chlamydomonas_euryale.AAC.9
MCVMSQAQSTAARHGLLTLSCMFCCWQWPAGTFRRLDGDFRPLSDGEQADETRPCLLVHAGKGVAIARAVREVRTLLAFGVTRLAEASMQTMVRWGLADGRPLGRICVRQPEGKEQRSSLHLPSTPAAAACRWLQSPHAQMLLSPTGRHGWQGSLDVRCSIDWCCASVLFKATIAT